MPKKLDSKTHKIASKVAWMIVFLALTAFIYYDGMGVQDKSGVSDTEKKKKIYSRLLISEKEGVFHKSGLLGWCKINGRRYFQAAPERFTQNKVNCQDYTVYMSQSGVQVLIYYVLYSLTGDFTLLEIFPALLLSLALVMYLRWVNRRHGGFPTIISFLGILFLRYLILMGDNLAIVVGANLLVFVGILWAIESSTKHLFLVTGALMLFKYLLTGAEFIVSIIFTAYLPIIFYGVIRDWILWDYLVKIFHVSLGVIIASIISLSILFIQLSGSDLPKTGPEHFISKLDARTLCLLSDNGLTRNPCIHKNREALSKTLKDYLSKDTVKTDRFSIKSYQLTIIYGVFGLFALYHLKYRQLNPGLVGLLLLTSASILSPISYIILMHGHSSLWGHKTWSPLIWDAPFNLLGILLVSVTVKVYVEDILKVEYKL